MILRLRRFVTLALILALGTLAHAQLAPIPQDQGAVGLGLALRRLPVAARVLYVTAHPDDEHNGILVMLSRGRGVRTGLLTLTRGDGGQNEIGPELFQAIGILRTEELAGVHRYDAVEQYFSRAYEFGYSFSTEETFQKWGREETLGDVVRVFRMFRPDVILTLPLEAPGGGQHHQASAQLAREAFRAAAEPGRFRDKGFPPWQAVKIYQGGVGGGREKIDGAPPLAMKTGVFDPLLGMTWQEFGSISRAFHKCQGGSQLKANPLEGEGFYHLVDSEPKVSGSESDILDGVDVSLKGLLRFARGEESKAPFLAAQLATLAGHVDQAQAAFDLRAPAKTLPALATGLATLRDLRDKVKASGLNEAARYELVDRLDQKERELQSAIALAQGLVLEALTDDDQVVPGQTFTVTATVWNQGADPVRVEELSVNAPAGWTVKRTEGEAKTLDPRQSLKMKFAVTVGEKARYSQPYWRRNPKADRYDLDVPADESLPWSPPDVMATLHYAAQGVTAGLAQPAIWRYEGRWVGGEKQKVVNVVPALSLHMTPEIAIVPVGGAPARREFRVTVRNDAKTTTEARLRLEPPAGWSADPKEAVLRFRYEGEEMNTRFFVTPPPGLKAGDFDVHAVAVREGHEFREGYQVIAYDHTQERHLFHPASSRVEALPVRTAPGLSVGYVAGAGDEVEAAIRQLGVPVTLLTADDLAYGDLSKYTTIVTGIRAYQTRGDLKAYHRRVMKYVEDGGNLVVQYNKFEFNQLQEPPRAGGFGFTRPAQTDSPFAPYPASVSANRITDENAPVKMLAPESPILNLPNKLDAHDWEGWAQERGLYFLDDRDPRYTELVAMTDPFPKNPGEKKGGLVVAKVGKGSWTYVGLGLFRQLPAGTPGAYRLLANLLSRQRGR